MILYHMSLIQNVNIFLLLVYILNSNNEDKRINENKLKIDTEELHEQNINDADVIFSNKLKIELNEYYKPKEKKKI